MKKILSLIIVFVTSISALIAQPSEFDFIPNNTFGTVIATVQINGASASAGDFIAVFDEDENCAGAVELTAYNGETYCTLPVYGNDGTTPDEDEGIDLGETFTFKLWVKATGEILAHPIGIEPVEGWDSGLNGTPVPGWNFVDGKQINFDSSITYAPVVNYEDAISVFPNPIVDKANIIYNLVKFDNVTIALCNASGKQLITLMENQTLQAGEHIIKLNVNNLTTGIYFLKVQGRENTAIRNYEKDYTIIYSFSSICFCAYSATF